MSPLGVIASWVQESMHWYGFENKSMCVRVMHIKVVILAMHNLGVDGFYVKSGLNNQTYYCGNFIVQVLVKGRRVSVEAHFRV